MENFVNVNMDIGPSEKLSEVIRFCYRRMDCTMGNDTCSKYEEVARLIEVGFIQSGSSVVQNYYSNETEANIVSLFYGNKYVAFIEITPELKKVKFPIYSLTQAGIELYHLVHLIPDINYFESVLRRISSSNKKCHIKYFTLKQLDYIIYLKRKRSK